MKKNLFILSLTALALTAQSAHAGFWELMGYDAPKTSAPSARPHTTRPMPNFRFTEVGSDTVLIDFDGPSSTADRERQAAEEEAARAEERRQAQVLADHRARQAVRRAAQQAAQVVSQPAPVSVPQEAAPAAPEVAQEEAQEVARGYQPTVFPSDMGTRRAEFLAFQENLRRQERDSSVKRTAADWYNEHMARQAVLHGGPSR